MVSAGSTKTLCLGNRYEAEKYICRLFDSLFHNIDKDVENSEELSLLMGLNLLKTKILHINNL